MWIAPGRLLRAAVSRDAFLGRAHLAVLLVQGPTWTLAQGSRPWAPLLASARGVLGPMGLPFNPMALTPIQNLVTNLNVLKKQWRFSDLNFIQDHM